jgi:hypothetical protein
MVQSIKLHDLSQIFTLIKLNQIIIKLTDDANLNITAGLVAIVIGSEKTLLYPVPLAPPASYAFGLFILIRSI